MGLDILLRLLDIEENFASVFPEIAGPVIKLVKVVENQSSKLVIFSFFEYSIVGKYQNFNRMKSMNN